MEKKRTTDAGVSFIPPSEIIPATQKRYVPLVLIDLDNTRPIEGGIEVMTTIVYPPMLNKETTLTLFEAAIDSLLDAKDELQKEIAAATPDADFPRPLGATPTRNATPTVQ